MVNKFCEVDVGAERPLDEMQRMGVHGADFVKMLAEELRKSKEARLAKE
jgi:hypothetical protein